LIQTRANEAKIVAVARPQHQPVIAKSNRALIAVDGGVPHMENSHRPWSEMGGKQAAAAIDCVIGWSKEKDFRSGHYSKLPAQHV
jgi:hypothetical protein